MDLEVLPVEGSLVKFGGFEFGFESDFGKFVQNSLVNTVLIRYCDYQPVTKSPKIWSCDYSQMSF